jgi:hypothetical protein
MVRIAKAWKLSARKHAKAQARHDLHALARAFEKRTN